MRRVLECYKLHITLIPLFTDADVILENNDDIRENLASKDLPTREFMEVDITDGYSECDIKVLLCWLNSSPIIDYLFQYIITWILYEHRGLGGYVLPTKL